MFISCGDDNTILLHDINLKRVIGRGLVEIEGTDFVKKQKAGYQGGASSLSKHPVKQQARGLAFDNTLNHLAIGTNEGHISIRQVNDLGEFKQSG